MPAHAWARGQVDRVGWLRIDTTEGLMADFTAWHGITLNEHVQLRDNAAKGGYRFLSLSVQATAPVYRCSRLATNPLHLQDDMLNAARKCPLTVRGEPYIGVGNGVGKHGEDCNGHPGENGGPADGMASPAQSG